MSLIGHNKNEMAALHLIKSNCVPTILYGYETRRLDIWTRFRKFLDVAGVEAFPVCCFIVKVHLSQCRTVVIHCCKGDAASQWEMAILGSELCNL